MDEKTTADQYKKGFNEGYLISKHEPELAEKLSDVKTEHPRMEGFRDGRQEQIMEMELYPKWMKHDISKHYGNKPKETRDKDKE